MKVLYGTGNAAKLDAMKNSLAHLDVEIIGLHDMELSCPDVPETGSTPLENARQKALAYYAFYGIPVFSLDSGLFFPDLPGEVQPGVHVRTINGKALSDTEVRDHYIALASEYGDIKAQYRNAVCLVVDREHIYEIYDESCFSEPFLLTATPCGPIRRKGFPLDSISLDIQTKKYYYDMNEERLDKMAVEEGIVRFFEQVIGERRE